MTILLEEGLYMLDKPQVALNIKEVDVSLNDGFPYNVVISIDGVQFEVSWQSDEDIHKLIGNSSLHREQLINLIDKKLEELNNKRKELLGE